jgi:hypothetical protein
MKKQVFLVSRFVASVWILEHRDRPGFLLASAQALKSVSEVSQIGLRSKRIAWFSCHLKPWNQNNRDLEKHPRDSFSLPAILCANLIWLDTGGDLIAIPATIFPGFAGGSAYQWNRLVRCVVRQSPSLLSQCWHSARDSKQWELKGSDETGGIADSHTCFMDPSEVEGRETLIQRNEYKFLKREILTVSRQPSLNG